MSLTFSPSRYAPPDECASMRPLWGLFCALGLVSVLVGVLAIAAPHLATEWFVFVLGVLLLVSGITEVIHAVMVRHWRGLALHLLAAALYLFVGLFILEAPDRAAAVLTLLLAAGFLVGGLLRSAFAIVMRFPAWTWVLFNGAVDLLMGILILSGWPGSANWVIGLFVGIDLLFHGWSWVVLGLRVRTAVPAEPV
jgi:uncharacterized membrane protein HdeD (DUF308 family)